MKPEIKVVKSKEGGYHLYINGEWKMWAINKNICYKEAKHFLNKI